MGIAILKHMSGLCALLLASSALAGVCRIGTTEYETLQDAFDATASIKADVVIVLEQDIDVTEPIAVPPNKKGSNGTYGRVVDGQGTYAIRQATAGQMFVTSADFTGLAFQDVVICGGGEAYQTSSDLYGIVVDTEKESSDLTLGSGCVISNFVARGSLIGPNGSGGNWQIKVLPGATIAHNRFVAGGIFRLHQSKSGRVTISGGEIFDNTSSSATLAYLNAQGVSPSRTSAADPIFVVSGGRIHDNACTGSVDGDALVYCHEGPYHVIVSGGEIVDNTGTVFATHGITAASLVPSLHFSGGKVTGNTGYAVYDKQGVRAGSMLLSGDAIVAGNKGGTYGLFQASEWKCQKRTFLEGDFTGYAQLAGTGNTASRNVGAVYGTNLLNYAGAENIHQSPVRVLVTDEATGNLKWQEPNVAKIGSTEYATLAAALSAAGDGQTVTLLRDGVQTAALVPPADKAIVIDGAGHRIIRAGAISLVNATMAGGNLTFRNVQLDAGRCYSAVARASDIAGAIVNTADGVAATVTLGEGTVLVSDVGEKPLVQVQNGATVNLDGAVVTGQVSQAVAVLAGGTLGVRGATRVAGNAAGDIDVADATGFLQTGDLTGLVHVTVAGAEPRDGLRFGRIAGSYSGIDRYLNPTDVKIRVACENGNLVWRRPGLVLIFR